MPQSVCPPVSLVFPPIRLSLNPSIPNPLIPNSVYHPIRVFPNQLPPQSVDQTNAFILQSVYSSIRLSPNPFIPQSVYYPHPSAPQSVYSPLGASWSSWEGHGSLCEPSGASGSLRVTFAGHWELLGATESSSELLGTPVRLSRGPWDLL